MATMISARPSSFICSSTPSTCSLSKFSIQFPVHSLRYGTSHSLSPRRPRILPIVKSQKQTFSNFDEMIKSAEKPVLVDFYATWCGPCQLMVPILEQVSNALKEKIQIVKIDTEKYPAIANEYKIEGLPTFILFKDGKPCVRFEGALPADKLIQRIEDSLAVNQ